MEAELQAHAVEFVGKRLESLAAGAGRKAVFRGDHAAEGIGGQLGTGPFLVQGVIVAGGLGIVPAKVDHNVIPTVGQQLLLHVFRVGQHFLFGDGIAESVVAVPAHRGRRGEAVEGGLGRNGLGGGRRGRRSRSLAGRFRHCRLRGGDAGGQQDCPKGNRES